MAKFTQTLQLSLRCVTLGEPFHFCTLWFPLTVNGWSSSRKNSASFLLRRWLVGQGREVELHLQDIKKMEPCVFETGIVYAVNSSPARASGKALVRPHVVRYHPPSHSGSALRTTLGRLTEDNNGWAY